MINPAPYNAEAPPEALAGEITPTELHYVRSNFAVPEHDGTLEIGGAVENPIDADARRPARHAGARARRHARVRRQRAPRDAAAADRRAMGRLRRLDGPLDRRPAARGARAGEPVRRRVDVLFEGADHGPYHLQPILPDTNKDDLTFERALPLAHAADPAAEILIAYEMNGEPLRRDHGAPFRLIVPHWYAVASVKWLKRIDVLTEPYTGEFQTGHYMYEWPDRPPEAVTLMRVRARITDPAPASIISPGTYTVRGKAWSGTGPVTRVDVSLTGEGDWHAAKLEEPAGPYQWQDWSLTWDAGNIGRHTLRARATDAAGNVQPDVPPWNRLGYGNNAIEVIYVDVGEARP